MNISLVDSSRNLDDHLGQKNEEDEEIGVFGAEKYFKGVMDEEISKTSSIGSRNTQHYNKRDEGINLNHLRENVQPGTPSVHSESSWNSQSALLQSSLRNNTSRTKSRKSNRKNFFYNLGCKCVCSDKNAADVKEDVGEISFSISTTTNSNYRTRTISPKKAGLELIDTLQITKPTMDSKVKKEINNKKQDILGNGLIKENNFTFPNSDPGFGNKVVEDKTNRSLSLDKRLTMMSWDASAIDNDNSGSDESSDLFEIETITSKTNSFVGTKQISNDTTSGCDTPTTCYAPSEASIEWSVVTASAVDFSFVSDCEDQRSITSSKKMISSNKMSKDHMQRQRSSTFLGCKNHEAVKVAGNVHRTNERSNYDQFMHRRPDSFMPLTRFKAENRFKDINSRVDQQHALPNHSLPCLNSPSNPQLLFIK